MGKVVLILWIAAILFGGFWFGYYQEGANKDITLEFKADEASPGRAPVTVTGQICSTGSKVAAVVKGKAGAQSLSGKVIIDMSAKEIVACLDDERIFTKIPIELVDKDKCKSPTSKLFGENGSWKRHAETKIVQGLRCHAFTSDGSSKELTYFTYELPLGRDQISLVNKILRIEFKDKDLEKMPGPGSLGKKERPQFGSLDYFPVPLYSDENTPQSRSRYEVTAIKRGAIDAKVFEVPDGYTEKKPPEFMRAVAAKIGGLGGGFRQ
jgi:hypothetical protein